MTTVLFALKKLIATSLINLLTIFTDKKARKSINSFFPILEIQISKPWGKQRAYDLLQLFVYRETLKQRNKFEENFIIITSQRASETTDKSETTIHHKNITRI